VEHNGGMSMRAIRVPGIERIDVGVRQSIPQLHAYLRECFLDGRLPPGTTLSQAGLAEQLGVSRTPLREVLRMLQEEGFVEFEPNQRMRVAGLDPAELDSDYASRILLETLALSMTVTSFGRDQQREAKRLLTAMRTAARREDFPAWFAAHSAYHGLVTAGAGESLLRQIRSFADRSVRYIRIYQVAQPRGWQAVGEVEHAGILESLADGDAPTALTRLARHLARTGLHVLEDCAPEYVPTAVPHAVALVGANDSEAGVRGRLRTETT
jgi:DNA-binding GntR family transcriptional regulator